MPLQETTTIQTIDWQMMIVMNDASLCWIESARDQVRPGLGLLCSQRCAKNLSSPIEERSVYHELYVLCVNMAHFLKYLEGCRSQWPICSFGRCEAEIEERDGK